MDEGFAQLAKLEGQSISVSDTTCMSTKPIYWEVFTRKEYEENGEVKELWFKAGLIKVRPNGKKYLILFQQPNTDFFIFEPREDDAPQGE